MAINRKDFSDRYLRVALDQLSQYIAAHPELEGIELLGGSRHVFVSYDNEYGTWDITIYYDDSYSLDLSESK